MEGKINMSPVEVLVNLWRHECERVFCDKLTINKARVGGFRAPLETIECHKSGAHEKSTQGKYTLNRRFPDVQ